MFTNGDQILIGFVLNNFYKIILHLLYDIEWSTNYIHKHKKMNF